MEAFWQQERVGVDLRSPTGAAAIPFNLLHKIDRELNGHISILGSF